MGVPVGAIIGAVSDSISTAVQVKQSKKAAKINRHFQWKMRKTAMQDRVEDLKLAGLNPILAAGGQGAHSPSGSVAQIPDIGGQSRSSAKNIMQAVKNKAEISLLKESAQTATSQRHLNEAAALKSHSARGLDLANTEIAYEQRRRLSYDNVRAQHRGEMSETSVGRALNWVERAREALGFHSGAAVSRSSSTRQSPIVIRRKR